MDHSPKGRGWLTTASSNQHVVTATLEMSPVRPHFKEGSLSCSVYSSCNIKHFCFILKPCPTSQLIFYWLWPSLIIWGTSQVSECHTHLRQLGRGQRMRPRKGSYGHSPACVTSKSDNIAWRLSSSGLPGDNIFSLWCVPIAQKDWITDWPFHLLTDKSKWLSSSPPLSSDRELLFGL